MTYQTTNYWLLCLFIINASCMFKCDFRIIFLQCILVSEEEEEATFVDLALRGKYAVVFDPLDGSSNIDCGISVGTIFGIYLIENKDEAKLEDVLQSGNSMVAAGYCMYGSFCELMIGTGNGVNGFTLDPSLGEFILTHPDIFAKL